MLDISVFKIRDLQVEYVDISRLKCFLSFKTIISMKRFCGFSDDNGCHLVRFLPVLCHAVVLLHTLLCTHILTVPGYFFHVEITKLQLNLTQQNHTIFKFHG